MNTSQHVGANWKPMRQMSLNSERCWGDEAYDERLAKWQAYLDTLTSGLLRRERFMATPSN